MNRMPPPEASRRRKVLLVVFKSLVSALLLSLAFSSVAPGDAMRLLATVPFWAWLVGILLVFAQVPVMARRWDTILQCSDMPLGRGDAFRFTYTGFFFNQALPSSVGGDFMRAYQAWKRGLTFRQALASVLLERATGLLVLALFPLLLLVDSRESNPAIPVPLTLVIGLLLLGGAGLLAIFSIKAVGERLAQGGVAARTLAAFSSQWINLLASGKNLFTVFALGLMSAWLGLSAFEAAAFSMDLDLSYSQVLGISALAVIASVVPVSISGWGVRENAMIWLMVPLGVSAEAALGVSIWFGIVSLLAAVPGGIVWLLNK